MNLHLNFHPEIFLLYNSDPQRDLDQRQKSGQQVDNRGHEASDRFRSGLGSRRTRGRTKCGLCLYGKGVQVSFDTSGNIRSINLSFLQIYKILVFRILTS